jgi:hypothetical protein
MIDHRYVLELSSAELDMAIAVAVHRLRTVLLKEYGAGHGEKHNKGLQGRDVTGALGELAVAKLHHIYWNPTADEFGRRPDVAGFEVRSTTWPNGHLEVFPSDDDDAKCCLCIVRFPIVRIRGWIRAGNAKRPEWFLDETDRRLRKGSQPQYWVPQEALNQEV